MSLTLVIGPMFAGKSTKLVDIITNLLASGINKNNIMIINHKSDTRYGGDGSNIITHDGVKLQGIAVENLSDISDKIITECIEHVIIDEAHFFKDLYDNVWKFVSMRKNVVIAGLSGDYKLKPFVESRILELIPLATSIVKLQARCEICNDPAHYTRIQSVKSLENNQGNCQESQIIVGGKDTFIPVCLKHYFD